MRPHILITTDRRNPQGFLDSPRIRPKRAEAWLGESYIEAVRNAGGMPLLVPPGEHNIQALIDVADGVVLTGGDVDVHPSHYGQEVTGRLDRIEAERTTMELSLARACLAHSIPVLGVCGGMQVLAVAAGGSLVQDLPKPDPEHPNRIDHEQPTDPATPWHTVRLIEPASHWLGCTTLSVNSTHHQAVADGGEHCLPCGWSEDEVIEAICYPKHPFAVGVQWHPELLNSLQLYQAFIAAATKSRNNATTKASTCQ